MPGYQSGQRLASLTCAMVSGGEALTLTLRCTIAIENPLLAVSSLRRGDATKASQDARASSDLPRSPAFGTPVRHATNVISRLAKPRVRRARTGAPAPKPLWNLKAVLPFQNA